MIFDYRITIPKNKPKSKPVRRVLELAPAVITRIEIAFPAGCRALVHVQLFHEGFQLVPINPGADLAWDNRVYVDHPYYSLDVPTARLLFIGWSDYIKYDHKVNVTVELQPASIAFPTTELRETFRELYDYMKKVFGVRP